MTPSMPKTIIAPPSLRKTIFRWSLRVCAGFTLLLLIVFLAVFHGALYNRFVRFPREARAWEALRMQSERVPLQHGWKEYRGVCHSHSELSHDSDVPFEEILDALKIAGSDFIFMSDHCIDGKADYSLQWRDIYDGILFAPGFEMSDGFMPFGLPSDTVLDCGEDLVQLAKRIDSLGGLLFFAHAEQDRLWELPELVGIEIYNIHTDIKDEKLGKLAPHLLLCLGAYPDQTLRLIFDRQTDLLAKWDRLNEIKKVVGIAANDVHRNVGVRGFYTDQGTLLLTETSPKAFGEYRLNFLTRLALRAVFGPLEPGKKLFTFQLDPYERSVRYVQTHLLARELTEEALLDALRVGRGFIAFDMIASSTGFAFAAEQGGAMAVMGESMPYSEGMRLRAASPIPCRFTILSDGKAVHVDEGRETVWTPPGPGRYRLEAELKILDEWIPWVYTNPIWIDAA